MGRYKDLEPHPERTQTANAQHNGKTKGRRTSEAINYNDLDSFLSETVTIFTKFPLQK